MDAEQLKEAWQAEKAEVNSIFKDVTTEAKEKRGTIHYRIPDRVHDDLVVRYDDIISDHVNTYLDEVNTYFARDNRIVVAFDTEEFHNEMACILGVAIAPDLNVQVFLDSLQRPPSAEETARMTKRGNAWLRTFKGNPVVCTHGFNAKEREITSNSEHDSVNTQLLLERIMKEEMGPEFNKASLGEFESLIDFKRTGCPFLKHSKTLAPAGISKKDVAFLFPKQAKLCIWALSDGYRARECKICGKDQDLFMYCLEDAFVTALIYLHATNRGMVPVEFASE
jgi:hypothetical protein